MHRHIFEDFVNNSKCYQNSKNHRINCEFTSFLVYPFLSSPRPESQKWALWYRRRSPQALPWRSEKGTRDAQRKYKNPLAFSPFSFSSSPVTRLSCGGESLTATGTQKSRKSHKNPQGLRRPPSSLVGGAAVLKCEASPYVILSLPLNPFSPPLLEAEHRLSHRGEWQNTTKQGN